MLRKKLRILYLSVLCSFLSSETYADEHPRQSGNSFLVGFTKNFPTLHSRKIYQSAQIHPLLGIRYSSEHWVLGISTQFKILEQKDNSQSFVIWNLQEETYAKIRVHHPIYMLLGAKFLYMMPVERATFLMEKRENYSREIGVAASVALMYAHSFNSSVGVYVDLWRGTASRHFQSFEMGFFVMFPFPV